MNYVLGVFGVLLLQVSFTFAVISAAAGGGSFVGLGATLFAVIGVPLTALVNFVFIHASRKNPATHYVLRVALVSLVLPVVQLALMVLVSTLRL